MSQPRPTLLITQAALKNLPDYSMSLPTGQTIGKRWRRRLGNDTPAVWIIGEYHDQDVEPGHVGIRWYTPEISDAWEAVRRSLDDFIEAATGIALGWREDAAIQIGQVPTAEEKAELEAAWMDLLASWSDELTHKYRKPWPAEPVKATP